MSVIIKVNVSKSWVDECGDEQIVEECWGEYDFVFPPSVGEHLNLWRMGTFFDVRVESIAQIPLEKPVCRPAEERWDMEPKASIYARFLPTTMNVYSVSPDGPFPGTPHMVPDDFA